ncbi:uncharacterized protein DFL_000676 [Arthrobotrys flagrans]|uniref:Uncharacterized protein n=1 Tax=Arthrobotrys flagrans TaxID=97331 RepID=A0A437AEE7_ARTFL|nr:hypothetical protein DFL_000676 [Arthrobotrys flagrans]
MTSNASATLPPLSSILNEPIHLNGVPRQGPNAPLLAARPVILRPIQQPPPVTGPRDLDVREIVQSATREELQNFLDALISADFKNEARLQKYHFQNTQLREAKRHRAEAEARQQQQRRERRKFNAQTES